MADSPTELAVSARIEDLKFMQASNVNVCNFVSVKLSGQQNYKIWKAQMLCLMESQQMRGIVDQDTFDWPGTKNAKIIKQYDKLLQGWIFGSLSEEVLKNVVGLESVLDVWKKLAESFYDPPISFTTDVVTPELITGTELTVPEIENSDLIRRNIKLYKATLEGHWWKANAILKKHKDAATKAIGQNGITMLHLAVQCRQNKIVEKLLNFIEDGNDIEQKNSNGQTALHIAAIVGNKYAAQLLVQKRKELLTILDHEGHSPLLSACNSMKLNTYVYLLEATNTVLQSSNLRSYPDTYLQNAVKLLITAIFTKQYDFAKTLLWEYPELATRNDQILMAITITFPTNLGVGEAFFYPSLKPAQNIDKRGSLLFKSPDVLYKGVEDILWAMKSCKNTYYRWLPYFLMILLVPIAILYPLYELIRLLILVCLFPFFMLYFLLWKVLAIVVPPIKNIEKKKKEYKKAKEILSFICDQINKENFRGTHHPCYSGPILEAVRCGAYEVVNEILSKSPNTINCKNEEGHNIIQLAIINRVEKLYMILFNGIINGAEDYRTMTDSSMNNLVHLAGRLAPSFVLGRTTGAALQLQRELQWHKGVEQLMSPTELIKQNLYKETPKMVFTREHADLVKEGEKWMKTTSESCSITAALIVTIVFAAAITVPGGSNQETGIPLFKNEVAFTIFAVSDAISLFSAATALLVFLSILTTRFAEIDFLVSLPRRLIVGFCALILSTTAMMVAFGAILFLVFCEQRPWMLAPIGVLVCLPVGVIVTLQFPLVVDLFRSTYCPIFKKQSYNDQKETFLQQLAKDRLIMWILLNSNSVLEEEI